MCLGASLLPGGSLYSLIHLGGFAGDVAFYSRNQGGGRVLEMGCGDGRLAVGLCLGGSPLSVLQQITAPEAAEQAGDRLTPPDLYVGIDFCEPLTDKARKRLVAASAEVILSDFLEPLPAAVGAQPFDTVVVAANTLFSTAQHAQLLERCASALAPGGTLLLDVYNALLYHEEEGDWVALQGEAEDEEEAEAEAEAATATASEGDDATLLVRVQDEEGRDWRVYESDPDVDGTSQRITCKYEFQCAESGGGLFREELVHHYLLPEQLVRLLDSTGFDIEQLDGDFAGARFDPKASEHVVIVARRRA